MRDHGRDVKAALHENGHLVPGLEDLTAVNPFHRQHLENDLRPVDRELVVRQAEHGDAAAVGHVVDHVSHRARLARHLKSDVEAFLHAELVLHLGQLGLAYVRRTCDADLASQLESIVADVRHHDKPRSVVARDDRRHQADRAGTRDEHVLGHEAKLRGRVHGVAEGVEDGRDVEVDLRQVRPEVSGRHDDELGERAVALDADPDGVRAQSSPARHTVAASAADDVAFRADDLARVDRGYILTQLDDFPDELVADDETWLDGVLRPLVPRVDVEVGAADAGAKDADEDLARTGLRPRNVLQP